MQPIKRIDDPHAGSLRAGPPGGNEFKPVITDLRKINALRESFQ